MRITSKHNPRFRAALKLKASRGRRRADQFLVYGWREVQRLLQSQYATHMADVFFCRERLSAEQVRELEVKSAQAAARLLELDRQLFEQLAFGDRLDGVVAVADMPRCPLESLTIPAEGLVVVVESLEKPGNLGAVVRVCDGGGAAALIAASPRADFFHPHAIRNSLGAVFSLPLAADSSDHVVRWLRHHGFRILVATPRTDAAVFSDCQWTGKVALILGNEAEGLSNIWFQSDMQPVRLPMLGSVDSLNISTATAVFIYEAWRQRQGSARRS